jgi:transglutaminase-like putative cysteine protease
VNNISSTNPLRAGAIIALLLFSLRCAVAVTPTQTSTPSSNQGEVTLDVKPVIGPPAKWIIPLWVPQLPKSAINPGEDTRCLLSDEQINAQEHETFIHTSRLIVNSAGVQNWSHYTLDFDPAYQTLIVHWVRVLRGNASLNRLQADKIKVIQRERDLDQYLFYGKKSAVLILEDIRPGDILDIAYSLRGEVSGLGGFGDEFTLQTSEPVERMSARLVWPANRKLFIKNHGAIASPVVVRRGANLEYKWDLNKVAGLPPEGSLPVWYNPHPWVQLSELQTWSQVNQLAIRLFQLTNALSPALLERIAEWRKLATPEARALAAVGFVQDEVRYQGMEVGASSFTACDPSTVFGRRFGDCKDKALLLVTILRALQIDAAPVLVNTRARHTLDDWQPSTLAFNHAIVQFLLNGETFWIDATASFQRGPLSARYLPNYERGLVLRAKTAALSVIPTSSVESTRIITEQFRLQWLDQPSDLKVVTVATGREADLLRYELATVPRPQLEKTYLSYYTIRYPDISQTAPIVVSDNEEENKLEITEAYSIPHIWQRLSDEQPYHCEFDPTNIREYIRTPAMTLRSMPLAIHFHANQIFRIEATLPNTWFFPNDDKTVEDEAFRFHRTITATLRKLVLQYDYKALTESVSPDRTSQYLRHLDDAQRESAFWLTPP